MSMIVIVAVTVIVAAVLMTWLYNSCDRIAELLDCSLESSLRGLRCIILYIDSLVLKRNLEILHTLLECNILLNLVHAVLTVEMYAEGNLFEFCLLSWAC